MVGGTSGVTVGWEGGGRVCLRDFSPGNCCWLTKREARKKGKMEKKENCTREGEKLKMEGGFFFFSFHFLKPLKFVLVYQNGNFYQEKAFKSISRWEENWEKWLYPSPRKIFFLCRGEVEGAWTGMIGQWFKTKGLLVGAFSSKKGSFSKKTKRINHWELV